MSEKDKGVRTTFTKEVQQILEDMAEKDGLTVA